MSNIKIKNIIILLIAILINCNVQSQVFDGNLASKSLKWTLEQKDFDALPRVGIDQMSIKLWDNYKGTSSPSSYGSLLEINGRYGHLVSQMYFKSTWEGGQILYRSAFYNQTNWSEWRYILDSKSEVESDGLLKIKGAGNSYITGNVGIGTINPSNVQGWNKVLDVAGSGHAKILATVDNSIYRTGIFSHSSWSGGGGFVGTESNHTLFLIAGYDPKMTILTSGNVGIGTKNPDSKLTVNGTIHSTEVKVTQTVPADYVFEKYYLGQSSLKPDYTLLTLSEVEKFTKENHHLPNMPSAKEIKENGLLLGEMSNILLQKIEELTLYSIEQEKKNNLQSKEIDALKKEIESFKTLSERFSKIENQLKNHN